MDRREFIKSTAIIAAGTGTSQLVAASNPASGQMKPKAPAEPETPAEGKLIISAPMLQNYAETSMGIAFAVSDLANGYAIYGEQADLSDGKMVKCGGYRVTDMNDKVMLIRLTGLKPATRYYYRIGADRIHYGGGYDMKIIGHEEDERIYTFRTAGKKADAHFCVINDTHVQWEAIAAVMDKVAELKPECVIWNGDASNTEETIENQIDIFLTPHIDRKDYAAETPYLFCCGNHDSRGMANRHLERVWMYRQPEERASRDWDLGRNFAVRMGDVALIGLDTAEDKLDTNPHFAGLFSSAAYREAQVAWLKDALRHPKVESAPFLLAFCHIPLFCDDPKANPGDIAPDDTDPAYHTNFAAWQRTCANLWTPLLKKAGCQLIVCAHEHVFRYDAPTKERPWGQLVGGGHDMDPKYKDSFPTVIEGRTEGDALKITVYNVRDKSVEKELCFLSRKGKKGEEGEKVKRGKKAKKGKNGKSRKKA